MSAEGDADEFRRLEQVWVDSPERTVVFEGIDGWNDSVVIALVEQLVWKKAAAQKSVEHRRRLR